ncbi:Rha family transcriptional regulator [Pantoea sp. Bo_2]|uniref:Rha family transcriptional regulator n=1 Tax=unclassified Pantoea TaxID=2630326 RepID=UPI0012326A1A|nr:MULTISPECIES: Rha family transcriptional regulator [unclassified Pantoea]KAA5940505.1 Rha family transcriptional regulator [Pantoea sp. VH_3]KAA5949651.1 Rha family transcriptional regulator [Pantoea sp. VH_25]KAA5955380.1 Rha family transcriptional regulator [Pantoea sp. VH_24]KAA5959000.1 Rha family transcriptional regulator [Pantoea sp. VH_16]KAA5964197.1 Rha family transcriptional regulator [Pantoea sp. VH_18]
MLESISTKIPQISIREGHLVTTSLDVADFFNKQHKDILRKIDLLDSSPEFNRRNFAPVKYTDAKGEQRPAYEITKNGFVFLVMGFAGKKAAAFKEAYIAEFDRMEAELHRSESRDIIQGDGHSLLIHFDEHHQISFTEKVPANAVVATMEKVHWWAAQNGYMCVSQEELKNMTLAQLLALK